MGLGWGWRVAVRGLRFGEDSLGGIGGERGEIHRLGVTGEVGGEDANIFPADEVFFLRDVARGGERVDFEGDGPARVFAVEQVRGRDAVDPDFNDAANGFDAEAGPFVKRVGSAATVVGGEGLEPEPVFAVVVEDAAGPLASGRRVHFHLIAVEPHARGAGCVDTADENTGVEAAGLVAIDLEDEVAECFLGAEKCMLGRAADHVADEFALFDDCGCLGGGADDFPAGEIAAVEEFTPRRRRVRAECGDGSGEEEDEAAGEGDHGK